ncbi:hypothetical protein [Longimicrobium sp.]|jgi:hypothetical protein|uniref:hypothetical protein n=1 Tax=Longimicrobium sp. TaxID=2029185 RepID=UPI002F936A6F
MSAVASYVDEMLKVSEWTSNFRVLNALLATPASRTMHIVQRTWDPPVPPFRFAASGISLYFVCSSLSGLGDQSFAAAIAQPVLFTIFSLLFLAITYKIFRDVSKAPRTYEEFLVLAAIVNGVYGYLTAGVALLSFLNVEWGVIGLAAMSVYMCAYTLRAYKEFWGMSYKNIIVYSLLASVGIFIALGVVLAIFMVLIANTG